MSPLPALIIVMGTSGCGKSTVGLGLAQALAIPFVDGDDLHPAANVVKMSEGHPLTDEDRIPWLHRIREDAILLTSSAGLAALDTPAPPPTDSDAASSAVSHELSIALARIQPASLQARKEAKEAGHERKREGVVVACSALKRQYRELLRGEACRFVLEDGREISEDKHLDKHIETFFVYLDGSRPLLLNRMQNRPGHFMKATMLDSQLATLERPEEGREPNVVVVRLGQGDGGSEERGKDVVVRETVERVERALGKE
ncbi:hypothetical protein JCM10212_003407 [Sporobolomyces blumeae]